jgi:hypothetical protein
MQHVISNWQSICSNFPGGNRRGGCWLPGYTTGSEGGDSLSGGKTLAQTIRTMKSPRNQNGNAVGTVRTGMPYTAELGDANDSLPRFYEQHVSKSHSPQEIPLPEEESFRDFLNSKLPRHKASQALRDKVRSTIEKNEIW